MKAEHEIILGWILISIALLTAWSEVRICILYVTVIAMMIRRVLLETDSIKFERALVLLCAANVALFISLILVLSQSRAHGIGADLPSFNALCISEERSFQV